MNETSQKGKAGVYVYTPELEKPHLFQNSAKFQMNILLCLLLLIFAIM